MKGILFVLAVLAVGSASAHEGRIVNLKQVPGDHQVAAVAYCHGEYEVRLKDGSTRKLREFDLRLKTDSGANGPAPGTPVLLRAGMTGDRAFLIFSGPGEIGDFIKKAC